MRLFSRGERPETLMEAAERRRMEYRRRIRAAGRLPLIDTGTAKPQSMPEGKEQKRRQ